MRHRISHSTFHSDSIFADCTLPFAQAHRRSTAPFASTEGVLRAVTCHKRGKGLAQRRGGYPGWPPARPIGLVGVWEGVTHTALATRLDYYQNYFKALGRGGMHAQCFPTFSILHPRILMLSGSTHLPLRSPPPLFASLFPHVCCEGVRLRLGGGARPPPSSCCWSETFCPG